VREEGGAVKTLSVSLPYPPSANRYYRVFRGRAVKSSEARSYQTGVRLLVASLHSDWTPLTGDVALELRFFRPAKRGDLDNLLKVTLDSLNGLVYADDSQVTRILAERREDKLRPRVEVTVTEATP
jgi:crossover junction endodeoxyribonuclease RusA